MKRTHFLIPTPAIERLQELSKNLDVSIAALIRRAIDEFLKRQK